MPAQRSTARNTTAFGARRSHGPGDLLGPRRRPRRSRFRLPRPGRRVVAAGCLTLAALLTARLAGDGARLQEAWGNTEELVVVTRPVPAGHALVAEDVERRRVPEALVPAGAVVAHPDQALPVPGRITATALVPGEILVADRLAPPGFDDGAGTGPDGRVVAIPLDLPAPPLATGDRVDLLAAGQGRVEVVAERSEVVGIDEGTLSVLVEGPEVTGVVAALLNGTVVPTLRPG